MVNAHFTKGIFFLHVFVYEKKTQLSPIKVLLGSTAFKNSGEKSGKERDIRMNYLIQPKKYKSLMADEGSKAIMDKTIVFFENMGKQRLLDDYNKKIWYREFIDFLA